MITKLIYARQYNEAMRCLRQKGYSMLQALYLMNYVLTHHIQQQCLRCFSVIQCDVDNDVVHYNCQCGRDAALL